MTHPRRRKLVATSGVAATSTTALYADDQKATIAVWTTAQCPNDQRSNEGKGKHTLPSEKSKSHKNVIQNPFRGGRSYTGVAIEDY